MTEEGELWTFGSGSDGKTGHGISEAKRTPKQVTRFLKDGEEIRVKIGQVRFFRLFSKLVINEFRKHCIPISLSRR